MLIIENGYSQKSFLDSLMSSAYQALKNAREFNTCSYVLEYAACER